MLQSSASLREPGGAALLACRIVPLCNVCLVGVDEILLCATRCQFVLLLFLSTATSLPTFGFVVCYFFSGEDRKD